ncbi:ferrochelatase [Oligoflexia bacterium]|nr:ferrochelatase [Oligoflexia bacterium]
MNNGTPEITNEKIGILIAQLGTPDAPSKEAVKAFLREFLSDKRVIQKQGLFWKCLLNLIILPFRSGHAAKMYAAIWTEAGSPLLVHTQAQAAKLEPILRDPLPGLEIEYGMRYGTPPLEDALDRLIAKGCNRILLFPQYPQFSYTTTASIYDAVSTCFQKYKAKATLQVIEPFFIHQMYLTALAELINGALKDLRPEYLLLSYHGLPESYVEKGDPYPKMCSGTTENLIPLIKGVDNNKILQCYQSRFGKAEWIKPYTIETVEALAQLGVKRVAVAFPCFTVDCLETLYEIGSDLRSTFLDRGGEELSIVPCLNTSPAWLDAMRALVLEAVQEPSATTLLDWKAA